MAKKPAPSGGTAKHPAAAPKHAAAAPAAKHNAANAHAKPAGHPAGAKGKKKPPPKHHPAKKAAKKPTLSQQVARLVAADVKKDLAKLAKSHPTTHKTGAPLGLDDVPCCAAEALAASLRIAGMPVGDADTWTLHYLAGGTEAAPTSILAALVAAQTATLCGAVPTWRRADTLRPGTIARLSTPYGPHAVTLHNGGVWTWGEWRPLTRPLAVTEAWEVSWH